jgi:hypothetical protein
VANHLYIASISTKPKKDVSRVDGLGLTWTRKAMQCSGNGATQVEIWYAIGAPNPSGNVTCTLVSGSSKIAMVVSHYSGVDKDFPLETVVTANVIGVGAPCGASGQTSSFSFDLATTAPSSQVFAAAAIGNVTLTAGGAYTKRREMVQGTGGNASTVAVEDRSVSTASTVAVNGTLSGTTDWAAAAIELHPAQVHPRLFFSAANLPAPSSSPERQAIYLALRAIVDTPCCGPAWTTIIPSDPGGSDAGYDALAYQMATMAFVYVLDPTLTTYRDKALEFADKFVQIHQSRLGVGGWGGTNCTPPNCTGITPFDIRDTGLSYSIRWMAAVYDWLYDFIPVTVQNGKTYRTKAQYAQAINDERLRMGFAIQNVYTQSMGNWWPNHWTQNHNTEDFTAFATATWGLENELFLSPAARAQVLQDVPIADDAMTRIKSRYDQLTPDGADGEGYHYLTVGLAALMLGAHVERQFKGQGGPDNWPHGFLNAFANWMVANILDNQNRSFLVKEGDLAGSDPPVLNPYWGGAVGIGHQAVSLAHVAASQATDPTRKSNLQWAAERFKEQELATSGHVRRNIDNAVLDYLIEYLEYDSSISPVMPTAKRYSFPDRHVYVWTEGFGVNDAKVASIGGGYFGDYGIDHFPIDPPWNPSYVVTSDKLNVGHAHEDAGQYYFRIGHTELTTEYSPQTLAQNGAVSAVHNTLLIDPEYKNPDNSPSTPDQYPETSNPTECGQYDPDLAATADLDEGPTLVPTKAGTPYDLWVGASAADVTADYVVHDLAPRYQDPADESANPTGSRLSRYDRRILWLRKAPEMGGQGLPGPVLFVHDEVDSPLPHTFEWRHHAAVPATPTPGTVAPNSDPLNTLPIWLVDCPDQKSLVLALAAPTTPSGSPQGAPFQSFAHQHSSLRPEEDNPPRFVRLTNTAPTTSTHVGFMMYPIITNSWPGPTGQPPPLTASNFDRQNSANVLAFDWETASYIHSLNFMDDAAEQVGPLLVGGAAHAAAGYVAERKSDGTVAQAVMFVGNRVVDQSAAPANRDFIMLNQAWKQADLRTSIDAVGRLDINVSWHNAGELAPFLDRAVFYEHPTSQSFITSVWVDGINVDTETPRRWFWAHQIIDGLPHVQLAVPGPGGKNPFEIAPPLVGPGPNPNPAGPRPFPTALAAPRMTSSAGTYEVSYTISADNTPVKLEVFDLKGARVDVLVNDIRGPGSYTVSWDPRRHSSSASNAGMYFVRLSAGLQRFTKKVAVVAN